MVMLLDLVFCCFVPFRLKGNPLLQPKHIQACWFEASTAKHVQTGTFLLLLWQQNTPILGPSTHFKRPDPFRRSSFIWLLDAFGVSK